MVLAHQHLLLEEEVDRLDHRLQVVVLLGHREVVGRLRHRAGRVCRRRPLGAAVAAAALVAALVAVVGVVRVGEQQRVGGAVEDVAEAAMVGAWRQ